MLTPAACYPVYPIAAARGAVPAGGLRFDVACDCFRREPSRDLDRLQSFRMREYVCIGSPEQVQAFRERWIARATGIADQLGLTYTVAQASDPFFGRVGQIMAFSQLEQSLKFELLVPLRGPGGTPTACMSFNYHQDHFGETWGLHDEAAKCLTPAASPSAWTDSRSRSSPPTASRRRDGRRRPEIVLGFSGGLTNRARVHTSPVLQPARSGLI